MQTYQFTAFQAHCATMPAMKLRGIPAKMQLETAFSERAPFGSICCGGIFAYTLAGGCRNEETQSVRRIATRILRNKSPKRAISTPAERTGIKAAAENFVSNK